MLETLKLINKQSHVLLPTDANLSQDETCVRVKLITKQRAVSAFCIFNMINEKFSYAEEEILKIKKDNHDIIIGNVFGRIVRWYMDSYDFDKSKEKLNSELTGAGLALSSLGIGQYGACNIYDYGNISWFIELAMSKAKYLNLLHHKEKLPNYEYFVKLIE